MPLETTSFWFAFKPSKKRISDSNFEINFSELAENSNCEFQQRDSGLLRNEFSKN